MVNTDASPRLRQNAGASPRLRPKGHSLLKPGLDTESSLERMTASSAVDSAMVS